LAFETIGDNGYLGLNMANKLPVPKLRIPQKPKTGAKKNRSNT
jgi:hypothetical protein